MPAVVIKASIPRDPTITQHNNETPYPPRVRISLKWGVGTDKISRNGTRPAGSSLGPSGTNPLLRWPVAGTEGVDQP